MMSYIPKHCWWYHWSQLSQHTPGVFHLTAFSHIAHGYLMVRGPGFGSDAYNIANKRLQRYNNMVFSRHTGPFILPLVVIKVIINWLPTDKYDEKFFMSVEYVKSPMSWCLRCNSKSVILDFINNATIITIIVFFNCNILVSVLYLQCCLRSMSFSFYRMFTIS